MVYELSKGSLYPLQGGADEKVCAAMIHLILCISGMVMYQSSNSTDSCQNVDGAHLMSENKTNILHVVMSPRKMITVIVNTLISVAIVVDLKPAAQPMMYRTRLNHNF